MLRTQKSKLKFKKNHIKSEMNFQVDTCSYTA